MEQPVIVCGLGRIGWRVLDVLRATGVPVVAVDNCCKADDPRLGNVRLVQGDYCEAELLQKAGLHQARGVLILSSNDLVNISAVLMVRHLHPNVRVVVRLFNQNLILRLGKAVSNTFALSVSGLTAPLIALTALTGNALGTFPLEDGRRQVAELTVDEDSPARGRTVGEVASAHRALVLAHLPCTGEDRFLLDVAGDARLQLGDRLVFCGLPHDLGPLLAQGDEDNLVGVRWAGWLRRYGRIALRTLTEIELPVKVCTAVLVLVIMVSTLTYHLGLELTLPRSLYRAISVIATGADMHGEDYQGAWPKVFVSVLRITGAAMVAAFTAIITNYLLRARLGGALEIRRIPDSGHVVVCGLGNIGFRVVEELVREGERVVVIELSGANRFLATARRLGAAVILGDATVMEVQRQAHADTARAVVAATNNELANLEIALLTRELNPRQRVVVRLYQPSLAQTLREGADIRLALSIPALAAPSFVAALFGDRVLSVFLVRGKPLAVIEVIVQADDAFLQGQVVRTLANDYRLLPVGLKSANLSFRLEPWDVALQAGDRLTVIAALPDLERFLRRERPRG